MTISKEDFDAWRDNHVTEEVLRACSIMHDTVKDVWLQASWGAGKSDPLLLAELRAKAHVWQDVMNLSFETLEEALGYEPERDTSDRV